jgi:NCAIR mutase (PurE)-related protein
MDEFRLDWERASRCGTSEAVLCEPKSPAQIDAIIAHAKALERRLLLTRLGPAQVRPVSRQRHEARSTTTKPRGRRSWGRSRAAHSGRVAIVCGGTSDMPVAGEALRTLAFAGGKRRRCSPTSAWPACGD